MRQSFPFFVVFLFSASMAFSQIPTDNLKLWLDANKSVQIGSENVVKKWIDLSGNGHDAVQDVFPYQPNLKLHSFNGKNYIAFADNDALKTDSIDLSETNKLTLIVVYRTSSTSVSNVIEFSDNYENNKDGFVLWSGNNRQSAGHVGNTGAHTFSTKFTSNTFRISTVFYDKSESTTECNVRINGAQSQATSFTANDGNVKDEKKDNSNNFGKHVVNLGARAGSSMFLNGDIAEVILYSSILPMDSVEKIEEYLNQKYFMGKVSVQNELKPTPINAYYAYNQDFIHVQSQENMELAVEIYDINGSVILAKSVQFDANMTDNISTTSLSPGTYFYRIKSDGFEEVKRFVKLAY